jgi:hypothetical protein
MLEIVRCVSASQLFSQVLMDCCFSNKLNLLKIYFNRYMRYVPTLAVLLLFYMSSFQFFLVDGPTISWLERLVDTCYTYWWSSLLLIQNYVNVFNVVSNEFKLKS